MAVWTEDQRMRLVLEESLLAEEFPHFSFQDRTQAGLTTDSYKLRWQQL